MQYQKPEIVLLGPSEDLILGHKMVSIDVPNFIPRLALDAEIDD